MIMWRKIPTVLALMLFATALGSTWTGFASDDLRWLVLGVGMLLSSFLYLILLELKRLTSDWPPGIIFAAGGEAERRRRRRRARRGSHDLVSIEGAHK